MVSQSGPATRCADQFPARSAPELRSFRTLDVVLILLLVGGSHLAYRASIIGLPPFTDGGAHACYGYFAKAGQPSTPCYPINLYPALVSSAGINYDTPLLRLRVVDALFCAISVSVTALLIYRLSTRTSAVLLGIMWSAAWLQVSIGNAGFKNTILPAFGLVSACLLLWTYRGRLPLFIGGVLIPLIPLVREPMAIAALVLLLACFLLQGLRGFSIALAGGVLSGSLLLGWITLFRDSPPEIIASYHDLGKMFNTFAASYMPTRWESMSTSITQSLPAGGVLAIAGGLGLFAFLAVLIRKRRAADWRWFLIAVLVVLFPLIEILAKAPFPYHWIQLGLGLMLLAALGHRALESVTSAQFRPQALLIVYSFLGALLLLQLSENRESLRHAMVQSKYFESVMVEGNWDHASVSQSFYLRIAKFIRDNTERDDTVFVSGFYYVLYPLSQRLPPDPRFHDATFASLAGLHETRREEVKTAFAAHPPQLVIESLRWDDTPERIGQFVDAFPAGYELVAELPNDLPIHYGEFGARIWRRRADRDNGLQTARKASREQR